MMTSTERARVVAGVIVMLNLPVIALNFDRLQAVAAAASPALMQIIVGIGVVGVLAGAAVLFGNLLGRSAG